MGWNEFSGNLTIFDLQTQQIVQTTGLQTGSGRATDYSVGPDGPLWSPDGSTLWVPQSTTYLLRFSFDDSTGQATPQASIALCGSPLSSDVCNSNYGPSDANGAEGTRRNYWRFRRRLDAPDAAGSPSHTPGIIGRAGDARHAQPLAGLRQ